jgi:UDP-2-acetamido-3-amino-2,3-dideoxy-glucuronate N-acetyltransferase
MPRDPSVFVHPSGLCESDQVGPRTRVWAFAHVLDGAVVGADCNICDGAFVEGGAQIGDNVTIKNGVFVWDKVTIERDVFVGPGAVFTNDFTPRADFPKTPDEFLPTLVRQGATIGANATIVCGGTIGERAFIAAGAVVSGDVPAHALMAGVPARPVGWVCDCGLRLDDNLRCTCGRAFQPANFGGGLASLDA